MADVAVEVAAARDEAELVARNCAEDARCGELGLLDRDNLGDLVARDAALCVGDAHHVPLSELVETEERGGPGEAVDVRGDDRRPATALACRRP